MQNVPRVLLKINANSEDSFAIVQYTSMAAMTSLASQRYKNNGPFTPSITTA